MIGFAFCSAAAISAAFASGFLVGRSRTQRANRESLMELKQRGYFKGGPKS